MLFRSAVAVAVLFAAAGCAGAGAAGGARPSVVGTTPQVADLVRNVAGDALEVRQLLEPGVDPHEYEPSPADQEALRAATVVFENGVGLEGWLEKTVRASGTKARIVDTSTGVAVRRGAGAEGEDDPHIWHDPRNAKIMVSNIEAALVAAVPARADGFRKRAADYSRAISVLDAEIEAMVARIPPENRKLVTNHDALGYFADRYGFVVVGSVIPSFDSQAELSASDLTDLVAKIKTQHVKAIFAESSLPPKAAETVSRDAGVRVVAGTDSLYADSMGPPGTDGATYITMERHNARELVANLA